MSRPIRRVLYPASVAVDGATAIHLGRPLLAGSSVLPAHSTGPASSASEGAVHALSGLAPGGVYRAAPVTWSAGGLLHHRFTLTGRRSGWRSVLCGTVPRVTPGGCCPPPCPVEPGRSSAPPSRATTRPPGRLIRGQDSPNAV